MEAALNGDNTDVDTSFDNATKQDSEMNTYNAIAATGDTTAAAMTDDNTEASSMQDSAAMQASLPRQPSQRDTGSNNTPAGSPVPLTPQQQQEQAALSANNAPRTNSNAGFSASARRQSIGVLTRA